MTEPNSTLKSIADFFAALSKGIETMSEELKKASSEADNIETKNEMRNEFETVDNDTADEEQETEEQPVKSFRKKSREPYTKFVYRIVQHHKDGISTTDIREITGLKPTQINGVLVQLKKQGKINKIGWGVYVPAGVQNIQDAPVTEDESDADDGAGAEQETPRMKFRRKNKESNTSFIYRIISHYEEGISTKNLREITGLNPSQISAVLVRLKKQGKVKKAGWGLYLPADTENVEDAPVTENESKPVDEAAPESVDTENKTDNLDNDTPS